MCSSDLKAHIAFKDYELGTDEYDEILSKRESLYQDIIESHEEIHKANHKILSILKDKESKEKYKNWTLIVLCILSLIICVYLLIRNIKIIKILKSSKRQISEALDIVEKEDKLKENFLRNITDRINKPLNNIVKLANKLSQEDSLTKSERIESSEEIQHDSDYLINLVCDILDLSKMEAGMIKFDKQSYKLKELLPVNLISDSKDYMECSIATDKQRSEERRVGKEC